MKRAAYILVSVFCLATACAKEEEPVQISRLFVSMEQAKVQLFNGISSVWNAGDLMSVFQSDGKNMCWKYTGADKASSGTIEYTGGFVETDANKVALYPYDPDIRYENGVIETRIPEKQQFSADNFTFALLTAGTNDNKLYFKYANAFIRVKVKGSATIRSITVTALGGENIAGKISIEPIKPSVSVTGDGHSSVTVSNADGTPLGAIREGKLETFIAVAPGTYKGFTVSVVHDKGTLDMRCIDAEPFKPAPGDYITVEGSI